MNDTKVFKRIELYEQVWLKPMIHLAKEYGISDNGLRKICKKLGVPVPKSGHWSKVLYGQTIEKEPLPIGNYPESYSTTKLQAEAEEKEKAKIDPKLQEIIEFENLPQNKIKVPGSTTHLHPLVKHTKETLLTRKRIDKGILLSAIDTLDLNVSPKSLKRALRISNSIILALAKRKIEVTLKDRNKKRNTSVLVWDERIFFRISEKVSQRDLTPSEIEALKRKDKFFYATREYKPTGLLTLKIYEDGYYSNPLKEFGDGKERLLEERINEFIIYLYSLSLKLKKKRIDREEQNRIWEQERRAEEAKQRRIKIENLKIKVLFELVDSWYSATRLRSFIEEVREKSAPGSELDVWIKWASSKADDQDVLCGNFLDNWKWNLDREKNKHWDLRNPETDGK